MRASGLVGVACIDAGFVGVDAKKNASGGLQHDQMEETFALGSEFGGLLKTILKRRGGRGRREKLWTAVPVRSRAGFGRDD
jgi:hypothetical protein